MIALNLFLKTNKIFLFLALYSSRPLSSLHFIASKQKISSNRGYIIYLLLLWFKLKQMHIGGILGLKYLNNINYVILQCFVSLIISYVFPVLSVIVVIYIYFTINVCIYSIKILSVFIIVKEKFI